MDEKSYLEQVESGNTSRDDFLRAEKDLLRHQSLLKMLKKEMSLKEEEFKIINEHPKPLKLLHQYQELDSYWELQKGYRELEQQRQRVADEDKLNQLTKVIAAKSTEVNRLKGGLDE